jgi:hypothetical protein
MTKQQEIAFMNPCFAAEETVQPQFRTLFHGPRGRMLSAILTVNIGLE